MAQSVVTSKLYFWKYRIATILKSFKTLYTLPPHKLEAFLNSYNVYNFDWANEQELIKAMGVDYYKEVKKKIVDWYCVLTHLCAIGQVEKMYIPPAIDLSKSIIENQKLYERKMCRDLQLKSGDRVLDMGCGRGRVANHVATHTGAHVTGINIDLDQLESAKKYAQLKGMSDKCNFKQHDINDLPFPFEDNSFDALYHIQVFSLSKDLKKLFTELHRILKPGGRLSCLDWVVLDQYNPNNAHHVNLMRKIKPLIGAIGNPTVDQYTGLLKEAGFDIIISENPSIDALQAPLVENADRFFTRVYKSVKFLVRCKLLPAHFEPLFDRLTQDGEALVEADRLRIVTTCYQIVAQKKP